MRITIFALLFATALAGSPQLLHAQDSTGRINDAIRAEGQRLYQLEMASWYGTDIFLEQFKEQRQHIGGYFSYNDAGVNKCIFFSKGEAPTVLATISFGDTYEVSKARVDGSPRGFTPMETDLYTIRQKALEDVKTDTLYKTYKNTDLNLVPLIFGGERKVYILTGPKAGGVVIFGNDYLLTFGKDNNLVSRRQLHKNIIPVEYGKDKDKKQVGAVHSHLPETGEFMTPTDVCTLLLYAGQAGWQQHYVVSEHYFSIWDVKTGHLISLTKEAMQRINEDQKRRHPNQ